MAERRRERKLTHSLLPSRAFLHLQRFLGALASLCHQRVRLAFMACLYQALGHAALLSVSGSIGTGRSDSLHHGQTSHAVARRLLAIDFLLVPNHVWTVHHWQRLALLEDGCVGEDSSISASSGLSERRDFYTHDSTASDRCSRTGRIYIRSITSINS